MEKWQEFMEQVDTNGFHLKEYLTRSEGPELFTTAINDKLLQGSMPEIPGTFDMIYGTVQLNQRRDISFPSIRGINPDLVPELAEFKFADIQAFTSITVEPVKFGVRIGISREMIEDNEVGLVGFRAREAGRAHRELDRREHFKCLSFFSTGPVTTTGVIGIRNHGLTYPQGGYTNVVSGTADSWETRIGRAIDVLLQQTITVNDMTISFPVTPSILVANPTHRIPISKVLNTTTVVVATGVNGGDNGGMADATNLAGTNVFNGILTPIYDPTIVTGQAFVLAPKRGLVSVRRTPLEVETFENQAFDADEMKTRSRYLPAVIEERFICDIQMTG